MNIEQRKVKMLIYFLSVLLSIKTSAQAQQQPEILVSLSGTDSVTCGSSTPCRTIKYAVEQRAKAGYLVRVNDGTYSENQIAFPLGVSLTAVNKNYPNPTVKIVAKSSIYSLLALKSSPIADGNHDISYVDISGVGVTNYGIELVDRNNVHIHHCRFHDRIDPTGWPRAIYAVSSEARVPANDWPKYTPLDGRDINAWHAKWTFKQIKNIEIDHVTIIDWGRTPVDKKAGPGGIQPVGWKGGSIHDSYFEATKPEYYIKFIQATGGYIEDVSIYNNTIRSHNKGAAGSVWSVEIWMHINTKLYNNDVNLPFSWTYGHGSEVYNNTVIAEDYMSVGIEGIGQSNYKVYNNFVSVGADGGMNFGHESSVAHILGNVECYGNVVEKVWYKPIWVVSGTGHGTPTKTRKELYNISVHHNTVNKISNYGLFIRLENELEGTLIVDGIRFQDNIVTNAIKNAGLFTLTGPATIKNIVIDNNVYYNSGTNAFAGLTETNKKVFDPKFVADVSGTAIPYAGIRLKEDVNDYKLKPDSQALNIAKNIGYTGKTDLWGNVFDTTPNVGAYQGDNDSAFLLSADFNFDQKVDIFDFNILLANLGKTGDCENPADADGDCNVGIFDYNILMSEFGN